MHSGLSLSFLLIKTIKIILKEVIISEIIEFIEFIGFSSMSLIFQLIRMFLALLVDDDLMTILFIAMNCSGFQLTVFMVAN
jgi:hypothetical protein